MAIAITGLTGNFSISNASSYNTASVSLVANDLLLVCCVNRTGTGTPTVPTASWNGNALIEIANYRDATINTTRRITWFYYLATGSASAVVNFAFGGTGQTQCSWTVAKATGTIITNSGADAFRQVPITTATAGATTGTLSFAALANSSSVVIGLITVALDTAITPTGSETQLYSIQTLENVISWCSLYQANNTSLTAGTTASANWTGLGFELLAAGAVGNPWYAYAQQ